MFRTAYLEQGQYMYYFRIALPIACASPSSREASDFSNAVHCFVATLLLLYNSFLCAVFLCSARLSLSPLCLALYFHTRRFALKPCGSGINAAPTGHSATPYRLMLRPSLHQSML